MELTDLEVFRAIAQAGSITGAARALNSSPAAVSRTLTALESRLNVRLAARNARRFALTDAGELLFARSRDLLDQLHALEADVAAHGTLEHTQLRVAAPSEFGRRHVSRLIAEFVKLHPGLRTHLELSDAGLEVMEGDADVVLRIGRPESPIAIARRIATSACVICAAPAYLLGRGRPATAAELVQHDCLVLARRSGPQDIWRFEQKGGGIEEVRVRATFTSSSGDVLHSWLLAGSGISYEALWDVGEDIESGILVDVLPEVVPKNIELFATFAPGKPLPPRVKLFVDYLAKRLTSGQLPGGAAPDQAEVRCAVTTPTPSESDRPLSVGPS